MISGEHVSKIIDGLRFFSKLTSAEQIIRLEQIMSANDLDDKAKNALSERIARLKLECAKRITKKFNIFGK